MSWEDHWGDDRPWQGQQQEARPTSFAGMQASDAVSSNTHDTHPDAGTPTYSTPMATASSSTPVPATSGGRALPPVLVGRAVGHSAEPVGAETLNGTPFESIGRRVFEMFMQTGLPVPGTRGVNLPPGTSTEQPEMGSALATAGSGDNASSSAMAVEAAGSTACLLYTSPSPRDRTRSRMPSSA